MRSLSRSFHRKTLAINEANSAYFDAQLSRDNVLHSPVFRRLPQPRYVSTTVFRSASGKQEAQTTNTRSFSAGCRAIAMPRRDTTQLDDLDRIVISRTESTTKADNKAALQREARSNTISSLNRRATIAEFHLSRNSEAISRTRTELLETVRRLTECFTISMAAIVAKQGLIQTSFQRMQNTIAALVAERRKWEAQEALREARAISKLGPAANNSNSFPAVTERTMVPLERLQKVETDVVSCKVELNKAENEIVSLQSQNQQLRVENSHNLHLLEVGNREICSLKNKNLAEERELIDLNIKYQESDAEVERLRMALNELESAYNEEKTEQNSNEIRK